MFVISENRSEQCFRKSLRKLHVCTKTIQVTDYTTNHVPGSTKDGVKAVKDSLVPPKKTIHRHSARLLVRPILRGHHVLHRDKVITI